ncbi:MAG: hypothetical protein ACPGF7_12215 [Pontibacterium sp.]
MINGISNTSFTASMATAQSQQSSRTQSLSSDNLQLVEQTLAEFDPDNLTATDAVNIVEMFADAGIQPGQELASAMADAGFDAKSVGDLAGVEGPQQGGAPGGPPPPPSTQSLNISEDMLESLNELLSEYYSDDVTDEEKTEALSSIKEIFELTAPEGGLVDVMA